MANIFDDPFSPADTTAADAIFNPAQPRTIVSPGLTSLDQNPLDDPMAGLFNYDEPVDARQTVRTALSQEEQDEMNDVFGSFLPSEEEDSAGLLSAPKNPKEGPTEFQKRNINWSDGGRNPNDPLVYRASDADFLETDYMYGRKEGASDKPILAANVFGRQFTTEELNRDSEGRRLLDLMQKRRSGEYQTGGTLANLAKGFGDWSASDIPYYGWVSDIGATAGEAIEISETLRRLQDGKSVTPHQALQARRYMLQQELEAQRTTAYQIGSVARQAIPFMAEMFAESMAMAGIVGAFTGGVGAIPGAIAGAAIAPAKVLFGIARSVFRKSAPKVVAKVTNRELAKLAARGIDYSVAERKAITKAGVETFGTGKAYTTALRKMYKTAEQAFKNEGKVATRKEIMTEARRMMADKLSRRAPEVLHPQAAARMMFGADYRTGAETAITRGLEEMAMRATGTDAAKFATLSSGERAKVIADGWSKVKPADRYKFIEELLNGLKYDKDGNIVSGIKGFSVASVKSGMEATTGTLVGEKYARAVADKVARQVMHAFDLKYGDRSLAGVRRMGNWFAEHVARGFLQPEHAYFAGGLPTIGHAGFSSFHLTSDALKEGLGRVFVEAPIQGSMNALIGPVAFSPIFAAASGHGAGDAVFKGQLGFQTNALLTGDRENMDTARQCAIGSLFVEYMSESAGRGLGLMAGGALASNPVARAIIGTKARPATGTTASMVGGIKDVWDTFLKQPLTKQAGSLLSRATEAVYGFGKMGVDKYASLATVYVNKLVRKANEKGIAGSISKAELKNAITSNSFEGINAAGRRILEESGINSAKKLAKRVAKDAAGQDKIKAFTNVIGLKLAQRGLTPDEIVRKFRQMGKGGIIEEMGEERLGDFMRGLFGFDETASDAELSEHVKSMFSGFRDPQQLMVEFFGFAWPGIVRSGMMKAQRWISTGALQEARERSQRIQNVMDIMGGSRAAISMSVDERRTKAVREHEAESRRLLTEALGTSEGNREAAMANASNVFANKANILAEIVNAGGLQDNAGTKADGTKTPGTTEFQNSKARVDSVITAQSAEETAAALDDMYSSFMQYATEAELESALKQCGASILFGEDGVKAIRKEWRKIDGHQFADGSEIEQSLAAYETHRKSAPTREKNLAQNVSQLANQVRTEVTVLSRDSGLTADQRDNFSNEDLPFVDEGIQSQLDEDLMELARNVNRAALSIDGDMGLGRRALSKIVGLIGAASTGDISLAMMNPAAWMARDSGLSPEMLIASNGYYAESLIEGFKKLRTGENGLETKVAKKLQAVIDAGGDFATAIKKAVESKELKTQTVNAMEEAGRELFESRIHRLTESVLAGSGILMIAQDQQNEAVLGYVANKHKTGDRDKVEYVLKDGVTKVSDYHSPEFANSYAGEIQTARDDMVDELLRLAGNRDALRFSRSARLGSDTPFFALDVVRAIKNGSNAEMLGAILNLPAFRDMAKVLNVSGLTEYERETLFSAMNAKMLNLTELSNVDDTKDLDAKDEAFVSSAMGRNNSRYTVAENQKAMKDFVRRCRLLYRGGTATFEDLDGEGRVARIIPENNGGLRTFRAVVYKAGSSLLDETYTSFEDANAAILRFGLEATEQGPVNYGFAEVPKQLVISDLNVITSTDSTSMVSYLFDNDREELRRQYLYRLEGIEAMKAGRLIDDVNERRLPPYLRKNADYTDWKYTGPDAAKEAARVFNEELAKARFWDRNHGNPAMWARGESLTMDQRRDLMDADEVIYKSVDAYEKAGDAILEANGVIRTPTAANVTLGIGNAWTAHLNYTTMRNGNVMVVSPDFASDGHSEGMLRYGIRQALDGWRNLTDDDSMDRTLLLAYAYREFKRCGNELADRLDRQDAKKANRVREVMKKVLRTDSAQIHTQSLAAIASSSVFFSCDRGLMQEGNGFLDGPEMAAIADAFRATDVFPLFASAIDEALGGTGFFHQRNAGSVSGISAWLDAFGRDGKALAAARKSTVFGDGKSARNPALVRYAIRADVTTPDMLEAGPIVVDRKPGEQMMKIGDNDYDVGIDENGLVRQYYEENPVGIYLASLSDACVRFTEQYAGIRGGTDVRLTTAQVYRMALRSNMLGGAASSASGARAKITSAGFLRQGAVNEAKNIELRSLPNELTPETARHFGAALRRIALASGMSVARGRTRLLADLANRNVPEEIIAKIEEAYNDTDLKADTKRYERQAEEERKKAKAEAAKTEELDDAEAGRSDDGFKEERNIAGLVDNDDTTALSNLLRWYFRWEGGSVSATLSRVRESLITGEMLSDKNLDRLVAKGFLTESARANVKNFVEAISVLTDKTKFDENNAKSHFWDDAKAVSEMLDDVIRVLGSLGKYDYAAAIAAIRDIPHRDGRRTAFLQMLAQMTVTDPMYLERDSDFSFSLDNLGTLVESDRTPNAIQDIYTSLLTVNTLTDKGAKLSFLSSKDPNALAKSIVSALHAISYRDTKSLGTTPTQWATVNDLIRKNFVNMDACPKFKYPGGKMEYAVAVDAKDLAAVQAYLNGETSFPDDARAALDNIQNLIWERMQNMAEAVDRIFGTGSSIAAVLRSRDTLAYIRRQADRALETDDSRERAERRIRRELDIKKDEKVPEATVLREMERMRRIRESGVERILQMANYFASSVSVNRNGGMWSVVNSTAFLADIIQDPLGQLVRRLSPSAETLLSTNGFMLGKNTETIEREVAKALAEKKDARQFVREQLRDIGMMKAATGREIVKALTPEKMDVDSRTKKSMYDATRIIDDQCLKSLIDAYVSSLPQSSRSLAGHAANRNEAAKNRAVMTLPSTLPADIRMECHELFNDVKVDGKSLREILEENGGRWSDGSRPLVAVVGAKDIDGTLVPKEYLAGILDKTIREEFENGNPSHILLPFFRADKPSCFAIRMPVRVATEWVKAVAGNEKLMGNLKPELAERIRTIKDALDGKVPDYVLDLNDQLVADRGEQLVQDAVKAAYDGIDFREVLADLPGFFTPEEAKQICDTVAKQRKLHPNESKEEEKFNKNGTRLRMISASRATDPTFFANEIIAFLERNSKKKFTDPTRVNAIEIWSKHDGLPIRRILEACKQYKCAPMVSFSITTLGDTAIEKGVLKYGDLMDLIEKLIADKVLEPRTTTIRVDPILCGISSKEEVAKLVARASKAGIKKFVTSMCQSYDGSIDKKTGLDRSIVGHISKCVREMTGQDYDWDKYYGRKVNGKVNFAPKAQYIREWATFFNDLQRQLGVTIQSCSMEMFGLKPSACADPEILGALTKAYSAIYTDQEFKEYLTSREGMIGGRRLCGCFANSGDMFYRGDHPCLSACAYCYAGQFGKGDPINYYNEDGSLVDRPLTRTEKAKVSDPHANEPGYVQLGTTGIWRKPVRASMYFKYGAMGVPKRDDVKSNTTFEAIINGERTSTTRYDKDGHGSFWRSLKVGDVVDFTPDKAMKEKPVRVIITQAATDFTNPPSDEEWSKAEGWATGSKFYKDALAHPKETIQIRYRRLKTMSDEEILKVVGVAPAGQKTGSWKLTPSKPGRERPTEKDQRKFNQLGGITKYVGFGKPGSSTDHYGKTTFKEIANKGEYRKEDVVGVSVNGRGANRLPLDSPEFLAELGKAVAAGVTFVADTKEYRDSSEYNIGEHELSKYLREAGYVEDNGSGIWRPKRTDGTPVREAQVPEGVEPTQTVDRDSLYRAVFGLAMTAAGQADIDPKRVATTLSVGPYIPLYKPADENDSDAACYFVSTLGGASAASLTGAYQIVGRGSKNVKAISEGNPEAQKLHIVAHTLGVAFKKGQGNDYGLGFDEDGYTSTLAAERYYQEQGRRELERILGLPEKSLDPVKQPEDEKDADKLNEWKQNVYAPHKDAVDKATAFLDRATVVLDDLETNKAGLFGSSFGFFWDEKSVFTVSLSTEKTNETTGEKTTEVTTINYDPATKTVTDGNGERLSGGWNVTPDAKNNQMPVLWVLSALCMAKKDGKLTNADIGKLATSWRKQNGEKLDNVTLKDTGVLADGDEFNFRNDGNGNCVATFKTRNISAQVVANNANSSSPEYGHSFATNATRDMEMLEELGNAKRGEERSDFVNAHAGFSLLQLATLRANDRLVSLACGQDRDLVDAYRKHPFDPEVRDTVAQKVNSFLRRQAIIGFYGTHGVMCPSAGNGHSPVTEGRGTHTVQIEWLPGTTQYDKDIFRPARIFDAREEKFYGQSRSFGSGCVNVRAKGFRYGLYLDEEAFDKVFAMTTVPAIDGVDANEWAEIEHCSAEEAEKALKLAALAKAAIKDEKIRKALLSCFTDYTGRRADESEGSKDARFDDLVFADGTFDLTAIGIGRSRRNSVNERDSKVGSIYLGGSFFCAHRSPSGNIEAFQGTVRATAPIRFNAKTGQIGNEAKYALDPVTMLLQGSDTDGDSAGLQFYDYTIGNDITREDIEEFVAAVSAHPDSALKVAYDNEWTEEQDGMTVVKEDVMKQFTRAAFVAQIENYRRAATFHQGQTTDMRDGEPVTYGTPERSGTYSADDVWSGAEYVDYYEKEHPELLMTREMNDEFVCDYGWAGRQPVGTDAVWGEPVEEGDLGGLNAGAKKILEELKKKKNISKMGYDKLFKAFVDEAGYGERTSALLDPEKSAMLSDAASDSAKARGISVFHQSRFLRALVRGAVEGAGMVGLQGKYDGYEPIVDLISHFDGISNNLFDTLKMMFATRAGWTQQMLPFLLGQIVTSVAKKAQAPGYRIGNAFIFTECANFLADLKRKRESTVGRIALYLHPTEGRRNILADAAKAGIKVDQYASVTEIAETFCRVKKIKIRDGVDEHGNPKSVTPRGKKALIVCANRMIPMTLGFDIMKSKPMQDKETELLGIQRALDNVREFGEMVDYMVDAGRDIAGQFGIQKKRERFDEGGRVPSGFVDFLQETVVDQYADLATKFTDSAGHLENASRELDDAERDGLKGDELAEWYEHRRENPVATGMELVENAQRFAHLYGAAHYAGTENIEKFGSTTREFVENFADAIRYLSNDAWRKYDGRSNRLIGRFFRALEAKDGRIDVRAKQTEARVEELRAGFESLLASGQEFTMCYRNGEQLVTVKLPGSAIAALLMMHASATRPFGATTSYVGQSNLAAAFGDERIRGLETFAARFRQENPNGYIAAVREKPVSVTGGKAYDILGALRKGVVRKMQSADLNAGDKGKRRAPAAMLSAFETVEEGLKIYRNLAENFGAVHRTVEKLKGENGESISVGTSDEVSQLSPWAGTEMKTRTEFFNASGDAIVAFRATPDSFLEFTSPEEAYNSLLAGDETNLLLDENLEELQYWKDFYRANGNRSVSDSANRKIREMTNIIADAASRNQSVYSTIASARMAYIIHRQGDEVNEVMTAAMNNVANMIFDGTIAEPVLGQNKAKMASEFGGETDMDAAAVRADFLERVSNTGFRGATAEQLKKSIPQAIEDGFKKAFGDSVTVTQVTNDRGEPTNLMKVVRKVGTKSVTTYVSYGDVLGLDNVSREDRIASILDMLNNERTAKGFPAMTRADLDKLSGHDLDMLVESFRLAGAQSGQSEDAADLGFAPVMSGIIRLSTNAGFETLFHEYFHQMLKCFSRFGVYSEIDRTSLELRFQAGTGETVGYKTYPIHTRARTPDGKVYVCVRHDNRAAGRDEAEGDHIWYRDDETRAEVNQNTLIFSGAEILGGFDEEAAADAYARYVTGAVNGWDELKLKDYCATDENTIRIFSKFRTTAQGIAEAMSRGPSETGLPRFIFATMFFGELTNAQEIRLTEPSPEQLRNFENYLLNQHGQFAYTTGLDAGQMAHVQQNVGQLLNALTKREPSIAEVETILEVTAAIANEPSEPAAPAAEVLPAEESYETIAGKTSQFLKLALTRFRRNGHDAHTEEKIRRYMMESVNGTADASEVTYAARRLLREVAALEGYVLEDENGNLTALGKRLLSDHNVAELAIRLISNTEEERQREQAGKSEDYAHHAGADFTFARAMEHVAPRAYWRFCRKQAELSRKTFMTVANRLEAAADSLAGTSAENDRLAESYRLQASELRGLALRVVPLAMHVANGDDLHCYMPFNKNTGNLHGLLFKNFSGGARFGEKHASLDGISRYDSSLGYDYHFDMDDPTITAAFDYAAMSFFVAEAARKYSSLMDLNGRGRVVEGVGELNEPEEQRPAEPQGETQEGERPPEPVAETPEGEQPAEPQAETEEPVSPDISEGGVVARESEIAAARQATTELMAELTYEPDVTPEFILSNPGVWLDQDLQKDFMGTDFRGLLTDHSAQAVCENGFAFANMFIQTFGLDTWEGDKVREMKLRVSNIGINEEGDFAKVKGKRTSTVFSSVNGALLGMIAWGENRVGENTTEDDIRMSNWIGQVIRHLAARERRMITGIEIRSLSEEIDIKRLVGSVDPRGNRDLEAWRTAFSPRAVINRHMQNDEQKRNNPETALDVMLYRLLVDVPESVTVGRSYGSTDALRSLEFLHPTMAGSLYYDTVEALVRGLRNAESMVDKTSNERPAYQHFMLKALQDKFLAAKGGDKRNFFAVPLSRSIAIWNENSCEMYRKLKRAGRTDRLLNVHYWANLLAKQFNAINVAASKSRYLNNGLGSNITLAGTTSYWFHGGTGAHVMNVKKYRNAMNVIGDAQASADEVLRKKEGVLFDMLGTVSQALLNEKAFSADGASLVKDRPLKYLAYIMGVTKGHDDSTFNVRNFVRDICAGKYANADYGAPLHADMKVVDVYMMINRFVSEHTLEDLAKRVDLGPAEKQDLVDRYAVSERLTKALSETVPGTIFARTEEQEFAATGRLGDSSTGAEALVRMCKEVVTAERFRGGLAQMLVSVASDGTPNFIVNPTDEIVAVSGLSDEYWGAVARFAIRQLRFKYSTLAYDEGKSGIENMRYIYWQMKGKVSRTINLGSAERGADSGYHQMDVDKMYADRLFHGILARNTGLDAAGNSNILTDTQRGEADCYMRQLFGILKAPSIDAAWKKLDHAMSWTKISSVGFSAFFNIATVFESNTAATGFWHTIVGMTKTGAAVARGVGRAIGRKGGTGAFTADALFMKDLAQYLNSDDPFVRRARELCDLIGMPLDSTLHFNNDRDNANPVLGQGGVVKGDIDRLVRWAANSGLGASKVKLLRKSLQFMYEHPTDYTFNVVLNAVKMSVVMQTMRRLREECIRGDRPFDPIHELRKHAAYINAEIGGIDPARYAWATPEMRKILSLGMFSWQWTVGAWVAGGGEAITDAIFGGHSSNSAQRQRSFIRWLRMLGIVKFGVPVVLQAAIKALSKAMSVGLPPDDELAGEIDAMPWFCPLNESKVGSLNFDVTPLLKLAARVPGVAWAKENVPIIGPIIPAYVGGGRNTTGHRRYYMHFGKQSDEFFRWFEDPLSQALAKTSIPVQKVFEGIFGGLNPQGYRKAFAEKGLFDRVFNMSFSADENAFVNLLTSMTSFSSQSISANPDAGFLAAVGPMKMGESKRSTRLRIVARLRDFIEDDRTNNPWNYAGNRKKLNLLCTDIFREAQLNGIPPDKILSSALGDLTKEQYAKLMDALPKDFKINRIDGPKAVEAVRALGRVNKKFLDIKSSVLQKYEDAGCSLKKSPAMRQTVLDVIRAVRRDPLRFTGEDAEELVKRYRAITDRERRSTQLDAKGGDNLGNFLATDKVPETLFGVPVVAKNQTPEDIEFFREHPEAGGFYELGNETEAQ